MLRADDANDTERRFQRVYRDEYPAMVRLARMLTGVPDVADDLAQEAFVRLYRQGDRVEHPAALLRTITVNVCRSWHTSQQRAALRMVRHGPAPNHAAFVHPAGLELTPAYDICPQARSGQTGSQAMAFAADGERDARISALVPAAAVYHLDAVDARGIVDHQRAVIRDNWGEVCDVAQLTTAQRNAFMGGQFLNPHALE